MYTPRLRHQSSPSIMMYAPQQLRQCTCRGCQSTQTPKSTKSSKDSQTSQTSPTSTTSSQLDQHQRQPPSPPPSNYTLLPYTPRNRIPYSPPVSPKTIPSSLPLLPELQGLEVTDPESRRSSSKRSIEDIDEQEEWERQEEAYFKKLRSMAAVIPVE